MPQTKKILYIDMDNVLVDFSTGIDQLDSNLLAQYEGRLDEVPGIFALMQPMDKAIESFNVLAKEYDTYILSTSPWENSTAWCDKIDWVKKYLVESAYKRLILSHHKNLNMGDYLVDDRLKNGADKFQGEHIHFGSINFPGWGTVVEYLLARA